MRQTGTGTKNTSSVGTTQGLKLKLRGYSRQKRDKAGYGSQSHHQDGHARGGPHSGKLWITDKQVMIPVTMTCMTTLLTKSHDYQSARPTPMGMRMIGTRIMGMR